MDLLFVAAALMGGVVLLFFIGTARAVDSSDTDRLHDYLNDRSALSSGPVQRRTGAAASSASEMAHGVEKMLRSMSFGESLAHRLHSANLQMTVTEYLLIWLLCILGGLALGYALTRVLVAGGVGQCHRRIDPLQYLRLSPDETLARVQ